MLPILPPTLRRLPGRPTKVRRKEPDEPQTTDRLSKRGVDMRCNKCKRIGHNKRSCKGEVGQNIPIKIHKVGVHNQVVAPTQQQYTEITSGISYLGFHWTKTCLIWLGFHNSTPKSLQASPFFLFSFFFFFLSSSSSSFSLTLKWC